MSKLSRLSVAVIDTLRDRARPVVTSYDLFRLVWDIYENPEKYPLKIVKRVKTPGSTQYSKVVTELDRERLLRHDPEFGDYISGDARIRVFRVSDVPDASAEEIACLVDPFSFVSHLSAMQWYGLTVRSPTSLTLTTPAPKLWALKRDEKMKDDYGFSPRDADLKFFKPLQSIGIPNTLRRRNVKVTHSTRIYNSESSSDSFSRVIHVGDLFVQMLDDPELCGGMSHVIETWEEHAEIYLENIIKSVEAAPTDIVRVRAGYILSERLEIMDERVEAWKRFAQRGGSRRLDPSRPYEDSVSEDWMISINV